MAIHATRNVKAKLTFEREDKSQGVMINDYHNDISSTSKIMEELLKKQQKLRFSAAGVSNQNGKAAERAINTIVNMASAILIQARMIYYKNILSIDFGQRKWTMLYGSKVRLMIDSMV